MNPLFAALVTLTNLCGSVSIDTVGARVVSYVPSGAGETLAMLPSGYGGIPLCWPWFRYLGPTPDAPKHGIVRDRAFTLVKKTESPRKSEAVLRLASDERTRKWFPHDFELTLTVTLAAGLDLALETHNRGTDAFSLTEAYHPYILRSRADQLENTGSGVFQTWNPHVASHLKTQGLGPDDWRTFLCIENGCFDAKDPVTVAPGKRHVLTRTIRPRRETDFGSGWTFTLVDADGVRHAPEAVRLPHDWAIGGRFDPRWNARTGALPTYGEGVYEKTFDFASDSWLEFGGVMDCSKVFVDGKKVCERPYGYASFRVAVPKGRHAIRVTASPLRENSRWYPGAGIYRPVRLVPRTKDEILPEDVTITTPEVTAARAKVVVTHPGGSFVRTIEKPRLWSPEAPYLYTLEFGGRTYRYGIRTLRYDPAKGFFLNGRHRQFKGVCLHHDLGVLGAAFEKTAARRQLRLLKEMGCDAIRTSHNPPAPGLLDLCDEMGLMVLDEAFDCWRERWLKNGYATFFDDWHTRDLEDFIRRDRNHPCVVLWSVGNEVMESQHPTSDAAVKIGRELTAIVHRLDPTRPVTVASYVPATLTNGFDRAADVFGANYLPGNYAEFLRTHPGKGIVGTETCSTVSSRGEYFFPLVEGANMRTRCKDLLKMVRDGQVSGYDLWGPHPNDYPPDVEFVAQTANPQVYGEFVWTGFDYLGEPDPCAGGEKPARSAYFGIFDLCGFPKDRYWLYRSVWRPDVPTAHILPHWNWKGRENQVTPVHVYSSGDEAEFFVNGVSQGRRRRGPGEYRFRWDAVRYQPGEVSVKTWKGGRPWAEDRRVTSDRAATFRVTMENPEEDLVYCRIEVFDAKGNSVPQAKNRFHFAVADDTEFVGACNGDPSDYEPFKGGSLKAFNGLCQVVLRRPADGSAPKLLVTSPGLKEVRAGDPEAPAEPIGFWSKAATVGDYRTASARPKDFDQFWDRAIARFAANPSVSVRRIPVENWSAKRGKAYRIEVTTGNPDRVIRGQLSIPPGEGPWPLRVSVPGAGQGSWGIDSAPDAILLMMNVHGSAEEGKTKYYERGINGAREDYFFYLSILAVNRAVREVIADPLVKKDDITYFGGSQGGAFGLILAALNPQFTRVWASEPALTDVCGLSIGRQSGWPKLPERAKAEDRPHVCENAAYYDAAHFAARITCPIRVMVGAIDEICPPHCVYSAYNAIPATTDKAIFNAYGVGHNVPGKPYKAAIKAFRETDATSASLPY